MARRVLVHVGLPKTATTYLQTLLWSQREVAQRHGLLLPGRERRDHLWSSRVVREEPARRVRPRREHEAWARVVADTAAWDGDVLVSHEFFAACSVEQARAAVAALAPAQVHVVATAREPLGLFTASWQESLKNKATASLDDYAREVSESPQDIWNWRTLDLRLVLERWTQAVPADRVHVLPLDRSAAREEIWHRFAGVLGVPAEAFDTSTTFPNESMGVVEAELLRRVNTHLDGFGNAFDKGVYLRSFLADERLVPRGGERFWPEPDRVEECRERGREAVAWLASSGVDVVGDPAHLLVPDELSPRRTPASVTEAEVADAEVIAVLLGDVRELRSRREQTTSATSPASGLRARARSLWRRCRSGR